MKNYIWDLDGTLIDSYGVIVSSLREVARRHGVKDPEYQILREVKTEAVSAYLRRLADRIGADYDELYQEYREISHERDTEIGLIPGAVDVLRSLRQRGASHFVYTHRGASTLPVLAGLGLAEFFTEVVTWEAGFPPKPSGDGVRYLVQKYQLAPDETAYIGDRAIDVGCAKDAGVRAVLFRPEGSCVMPAGAEDRVITRLSDLLEPFIFYCQLDYADIPYPCTTTGRGTIADNGCGPCCAAMVAENLLDISFKPWDACRLAIECGAREKPGTDLYLFAPVFADRVGLTLQVTEDAEAAYRFLREKKGLVIANTQGDRPQDGWTGVFSDSGHYIVLAGVQDHLVRVWDPMYRPGRYDIPGRAGKVQMNGNEAIADFEIIRQDCRDRSFFLFEPDQ